MVVREFGDLSMTAPRYGSDASVESITPHSNRRCSSTSRASGTLPPLFSTPASIFSSMGGISQVSKCGLIYCRDVSTICGGAKGAGSVDIIQCFCSKSPPECNIVKHLSSKVILRPDYLYIKCKKSQAWHEPSIDAKRLPATCDVETLVMSEKPHDVWAAYFSSVKACGSQPSAITGLKSSETESWDEVEAPNVENFERARNNLQTPKQLRLGPLLVTAVY
jgi:hypothetical protein